MIDDKKRVFISYSHEDTAIKECLVTHLRCHMEENSIDLWDDDRIRAGDDWRREIHDAMDTASIAILMVSPYFLTSDFIRSQEVPRLLERHRAEGLRVIPVLAKDCAWENIEWIRQLQVRPEGARPLAANGPNEVDTVLKTIVNEIAALIGGGVFQPDSQSTTEDNLRARSRSIARQMIDAGRPGALQNFWIYVRRSIQSKIMEILKQDGDSFTVVVDGAGYGKSILLAQLADDMSENEQFVPLLVRCDTLDFSEPLDQRIARALGTKPGPLFTQLDQMVSAGKRVVLMLDTIDILPDNAINQLRTIVHDLGAKGVKILGSCRPLEFSPYSAMARRVELGPFSQSEIDSILSNYEKIEQKAPPPMNETTRDLFRIPLHLRMFLEIYSPEAVTDRTNFMEVFGLFWSRKIDSEESRYLARQSSGQYDKVHFIFAKKKCIESFLIKALQSHDVTFTMEQILAGARRLLGESDLTIDANILYPAIRDLMDEGIFVSEGVSGLRFLHQGFLEFALARMVVVPLMQAAGNVANQRAFLQNAVATLADFNYLDLEKWSSAPKARRGLLDSIFRRKRTTSVGFQQRMDIVHAFANFGSDYAPAKGALVQAILLKNEEWGKELLSAMAGSKHVQVKNLAKDYFAALRDKAPQMLLDDLE